MIGALAALFFTNHSAVVITQCNQTVGYNQAVEISNHAQSFQPNLPIIELITITIFLLRICLYHGYLSYMYLLFLEIVKVKINW